MAPRWIQVELVLAGGHRQQLRLRSDATVLADLHRAVASRGSELVQVPLADGRQALTVHSDSLIGLITDPPVLLSDAEPAVADPADAEPAAEEIPVTTRAAPRSADGLHEPVRVGFFELKWLPGSEHYPTVEARAASLAQGFERRRPERRERLRRIVEDLGEGVLAVSSFNAGYLGMFENWVASCDRHGIPSRRFTVLFPTDEEADRRARELGFATYFDGESMGDVPRHAHATYGDIDFGLAMFPKVAALQDLLELGVDLVRQDMDLVWFEDPRPGLEARAREGDFDLLFMRDMSPRFQPLYYNSGFVFVRSNELTRATFQALYEAMPAVLMVRSEQQILNQIVACHRERGLRTALLPDAYVDGQLMNHAIFRDRPLPERPIVAHANWTANLDEKIERLRSCGWWYLAED
ncbi:MAG: putative nucleotide-diphospho-sugar transferase [Acidobacteriota bacterium]